MDEKSFRFDDSSMSNNGTVANNGGWLPVQGVVLVTVVTQRLLEIRCTDHIYGDGRRESERQQ